MRRGNIRPGFTLIEVLISATLLLLVLGASAALFKGALKSQAGVVRATSAAFAVQSKMEDLRSISFSDIPSLSGKTFDDGRGTIKVYPVTGDLVMIEVLYSFDAGKRPVKAATLRSGY